MKHTKGRNRVYTTTNAPYYWNGVEFMSPSVPQSNVMTREALAKLSTKGELTTACRRAPYPNRVPVTHSFVLAFTNSCDECYSHTMTLLNTWADQGYQVGLYDGGINKGLLFAPSDDMPGRTDRRLNSKEVGTTKDYWESGSLSAEDQRVLRDWESGLAADCYLGL